MELEGGEGRGRERRLRDLAFRKNIWRRCWARRYIMWLKKRYLDTPCTSYKAVCRTDIFHTPLSAYCCVAYCRQRSGLLLSHFYIDLNQACTHMQTTISQCSHFLQFSLRNQQFFNPKLPQLQQQHLHWSQYNEFLQTVNGQSQQRWLLCCLSTKQCTNWSGRDPVCVRHLGNNDN